MKKLLTLLSLVAACVCAGQVPVTKTSAGAVNGPLNFRDVSAVVFTPTGGSVIDLTKAGLSYVATADITFTYSNSSPPDPTRTIMRVTASGADRTINFPSGTIDLATGSAISSVTITSGTTKQYQVQYTGGVFEAFNMAGGSGGGGGSPGGSNTQVQFNDSSSFGGNSKFTFNKTTGAVGITGALTATTFNGNTLTTGTWVLTGAAAKTLTFNNTMTFAGTDSTTMNFPGTTATIARTDAANTFTGASTASAWVLTSPTITTKISPTSDDGAPLGDTTHNFSDLFLATGAVLNFQNGNVAITHSSGILTMGTGELRITTAGTNAASVPTLGSTSTLTGKTLTDALNTVSTPAALSVGYLGVPSNPQSTAYTTVAADAGKGIDHLAADANARTYTIDGSVAYPVGTCITFTNMTSQAVTIAIGTDTMYLAGAGTTGNRMLAQYGVATARKQASGVWIISGTNLT